MSLGKEGKRRRVKSWRRSPASWRAGRRPENLLSHSPAGLGPRLGVLPADFFWVVPQETVDTMEGAALASHGGLSPHWTSLVFLQGCP